MKSLLALLFLQTALGQVFEVASIKPSTAEPGASSGVTTETGRISARNVTLKRCIRSAYNVPEASIFGGPNWAEDQRYNIDAKAAGPATDSELMIMLRALLADRFKLVLHRETRILPGYALVVGKKGLTAKASAPGTPSRSNSRSNAGRRSIEAEACDMDCLARKLAEVLHFPVANATAAEGEFDFKLEWTPEDLTAKTSPAADAPGASLFAVLQEQLGLRLEARKVPTEVLVVDQAERATEN